MAVPIIKEVLESLGNELNIIDCASGISCNVVTSLEYLDFAVFMPEPTELGLHNFKRAVELCKIFNIPHGVVINRITEEENMISRYYIKNDIYEKKSIGSICTEHDHLHSCGNH